MKIEKNRTPGFWKPVQPEEANGYWLVMSDKSAIGAATCHGGHSKANAHLIAAAPDMLKALKAFRDLTRGMTIHWIDGSEKRSFAETTAQADKAITKAEM